MNVAGDRGSLCNVSALEPLQRRDSGGWEFGAIGGAVAATAIVGTISIGLALAALRRRVRIP